MRRETGHALYLDERVNTPKARAVTSTRSAFKAAVFAFVAFALLLTGSLMGASTTSQTVSADAGEDGFLPMVCGAPDQLGLNMNSKGGWQGATQMYAEGDLGNRTWTAQELFGSNLSIPHYTGEGPKEKAFMVRGTGSDNRIDKAVDNKQINQSVADALNDGKITDKLYGLRTFWGCTFGGMNTGMSNVGFSLSSVIASWVGNFATAAFDSSLICTDAEDTGCINLLKIMGGTGDEDEGIIGTLTSSIYFPLLVLAVFATAMWLMYIGLLKGKVREGLSGALWMFVAIVVGTAFLLNPALLAKAPMTVTNAIGTCVIGAFNGVSCLDDSSTGGDEITTSDEICKSESTEANAAQSMTLAVNGMSCSIWKAFVLEPYAQASFGQSFSSLDATDPSDSVSEQFEASGIDDPESTFAVNLGSSDSGDTMKDSTAVLDKSPSVSNVALYQLYLMTDADGGDDAYSNVSAGQLDGRWYNIVSFASADETMWGKWSGSFTGGAGQNALAAMSLVTSVLGGAVIAFTAVLAIVYYVITIVLMGVAPLFFLMAIHPGRGRRIFLGWVGQIASNVFKYAASAFFLVITVALYAGVLSNTENLATTFLFILILSAALFMYRGEIINMLGRVDMGGEALSGRLGESMRNRGERMARRSTNAALGFVGAGAGGAIATGAGAKPSEYFKNASAGMKDNVSRELKRKSGFAGNIARQADRVSADNRSDLRATATKSNAAANDARTAAETNDAQATQAQEELAATEQNIQADRMRLDDLNARAEVAHKVQHEVLGQMESDNPGFAKAQSIANQLEGLESQRAVAVAKGDREEVSRLDGQIESTRKDYADANAEISTADRNRGERRYNTMVRSGLKDAGVDYDASTNAERRQTEERLASSEAALAPQRAATEASTDAAAQSRARAAALDARAAVVHKKSQDWKPGEKLTTTEAKKARDEADAKAWDAYRDSGGDLEKFESSTGIKESPALTKHISDTKAAEVKAAQKDAKIEKKEKERERRERPAPKKESLAERKKREKEGEAKRAKASMEAHRNATKDTDSGPDPKPKVDTGAPKQDPPRKTKEDNGPSFTIKAQDYSGDSRPDSIPDLPDDLDDK